VFEDRPIPVTWKAAVDLHQVYVNWKPYGPDALNDVKTFISSVLATGVRPAKIEVSEFTWVTFTFLDWGPYLEFQASITRILDLLWLVDQPEHNISRPWERPTADKRPPSDRPINFDEHWRYSDDPLNDPL
jgi:hypothetical protein